MSKLSSYEKPTEHPGNDLQPYDPDHTKSYITAELESNYVKRNSLFTVGDNNIYVRSGKRTRRNIEFQNVELEPETYYSVFQRTFESAVSGNLLQSKY